MPEKRIRRKPGNEFDATVDEGTFGDYEAFGVFGDDSDDQTPEYEIFIVATAQEV
ncbi:MAG: hypothetical protein Q4Q62_08545 [Thermoplasmata archaeon]|nr:hypothetical protein [Thermoplasmata archaeon]